MLRFTRSRVHLLIQFGCALAITACSHAASTFAQSTITPASPAVRLSPAVTLSVSEVNSNEDGEADIDSEAIESETTSISPEDLAEQKAEELKANRLKQIEQLRFDRRPSTILKAWSAKDQDTSTPDSTEPEPTSVPSSDSESEPQDEEAAETAEREKQFQEALTSLSNQVTLGSWNEFNALLKDRDRFSEEEAIAIYERLLNSLGENQPVSFERVFGLSEEMRQMLQSLMANQRNNPGRQFAEKHAISFSDMIQIIRACPVELRDSDLTGIAALLSSTLETGSQLDDFIAALQKEVDSNTLTKSQAGSILSDAGRDTATITFLPTIEEATTAKDPRALTLLARHFLAMSLEGGEEKLREQAWVATMATLQFTEIDEATREEAMTRAISLAPQIREELGTAWLKNAFTENLQRGREILVALGTSTAQSLAQLPQDAESRQHTLELQKAAVDAFFDSGAEVTSEMTGILNLLGNNWLQEANVSLNYSERSSLGPNMRRDRYGNIYYVDDSEMNASGVRQPLQMGQLSPVDVDKILSTSPDGKWLAAIDASIKPHYSMVFCKLWLKVNEDATAFPYIETLAQTHPDIARDLAEEFLRVWTRNHNPNSQEQRTNYYMFMYGFEQKAESIPLTRSKQERNIKDLSAWVQRLNALPLEGKIDESLLVRAFMTCHSVAEVFDIEDIEQVFGAWQEIQPDTMAGLIQRMRQNLAGVWRDPNVQRDAKTNRRKSDIESEVKRGYSVANRVVNEALLQHPSNWQLLLAKASIIHDENDFAKEVSPQSDFSARRREAFDYFQQAANAYIAIAAQLPERDQSNDAFDLWFYAALGATDLRGLSDENRPVPEEVEKIKATMSKLTGELGKNHQDRFANALFTRMSAVNPACKFRYLENGFTLVGENSQASEARNVYDYYKDLVTELELVVRLDSNGSNVGSEQPFGIYVDLRHTVEIERESGGFGKYLQNQNNLYFAYNYGRPTENYRDKFEDAAIAALQDQFEVLSVTFNHPETASRSTTQEGWRITPYAYILLKAKGPEVDKIPSLKMDLDFLDTSGYVVLPITSSPVAIDAFRAPATGNTPTALRIVQIADERQSDTGKLIVETKATGRGLIPELDELFEIAPGEFELLDVEDSGVSVIEFDKESTSPVILSERTWTLKFAASTGASTAPTTFAFPSPTLETTDVRYQRYVDADLEDVEPVLSLTSTYQSPLRNWQLFAAAGLGGLLLVVALSVGIYRWRSKPKEIQTVQQIELTPFTVLNRLKGLAKTGSFSGNEGSKLAEDIATLETFYFAQTASSGSIDLEAIQRRWRSST